MPDHPYEPPVISAKTLDCQPYLMATPTGVVDLRTGECSPGRQEQYILNPCPTPWKGLDEPCPNFDKFLLTCMADNQEMAYFLVRLLGYALLGTKHLHIWAIMYGPLSRNGKDTLMNVIKGVLGPRLHVRIPVSMLTEQKFQRDSSQPQPDLLALRGTRIAYASEASARQVLDQAKIKDLTGGGYITARGITDKEMTEWQQSALLLLLTNYLPKINSDDDGFNARTICIEWPVKSRGVTIPCWGGPGGDECWRIRIRRRDADRDRSNPKAPKYLLVPQPGQPYSAPMVLPPVDVSPDLATWVIVEAELDAMAVHHACGGKIGVVSILSVRVKPDAAAHALLARAARILVALDVDQDKADGSNPGADAWPWWEQTYPQARLWPVPEGKDPGEALEFGVDLAAWVFAGTPRQSVSAPAPASLPAPAPSPAPGTVTAAPSPMQRYRRWPVPDVADFFDVPLPCAGHVNHGNLISAFKRYPFGHERCIVPCPKSSSGGSSGWWWRSDAYCRRCSGHPQCLLDLLNSQLFKEALANA